MIYQLKIVRKNTKPPMWKRALVPSGVTFDVMAVILENIIESEITPDFEFEIKSSKLKFIGDCNDSGIIKNSSFEYLPSNFAVFSAFVGPHTRFSFFLRNTSKIYPEYIIEVEEILTDAKLRHPKSDELMSFSSPVIIKTVTRSDDEFWQDKDQEINRYMAEKMYLRKGEISIVNFSDCLEQIKKGDGISCYESTEDPDSISSDDTSENNDNHDYESDPKEYVFERLDRFMKDAGYDSKTGKTSVSERKLKLLTDTMLSDINDLLRKYNHDKLVTGDNIYSNLNAYTIKSQQEIADEAGFTELKSTDDEFLRKFGDYMLRPETMKKQLILITEQGLDLFEKIMDHEYYSPAEDEKELLNQLTDWGYVALYEDKTVSVTDDVKKIYSILISEGYREYHRKAEWMNTCLNAFCNLYMAGPVEVMYQLYRKNSDIPDDYSEFKDILDQVRSVNGRMYMHGELNKGETKEFLVSLDLSDGKYYERFESIRPETDFYIPDFEQIKDFSDKGYDTKEPSYMRLYRYFNEKCRLDDEKSVFYCVEALLSSDSLNPFEAFVRRNKDLEKYNLVSRSGKLANKLEMLLADAFKNARVPTLKGYKLSEMADIMKKKEETDIKANAKKSSEERMLNAFFNADRISPKTVFSDVSSLESAMAPGKQKISPNAKCPCGSGKKYKKCCALK